MLWCCPVQTSLRRRLLGPTWWQLHRLVKYIVPEAPIPVMCMNRAFTLRLLRLAERLQSSLQAFKQLQGGVSSLARMLLLPGFAGNMLLHSAACRQSMHDPPFLNHDGVI